MNSSTFTLIAVMVGAVFLMGLTEKMFKNGFIAGIKRLSVALLIGGVTVFLGFSLYIRSAVNGIPTFNEADLESTQTTTSDNESHTTSDTIEIPVPSGVQTLLIWSVGSAGLTEEEAKEIGVNIEGRGDDGLADVVMLLVRSGKKSAIISFPRDMWIEDYDAKLSEIPNLFTAGDMRDIIQERSGIRINSMASVNFEAFVEMVDLVGGIHLTVEYPIRSESTGLDLQSGYQHMDGETALKYIRVRKGEELVDGEWVRLTGSDVDRIVRQQEVVDILIKSVDAQTVATQINDVVTIVQNNVTITDDIDAGYLIGWLSAKNATTYAVEGVFDTINSKSVLMVSPENSKEQVQKFINDTFGNPSENQEETE